MLTGIISAPQITQAETACQFTRNMELGDVGEDVRCLQEYLNNSGFTIAQSGVGSPGRETNQFQLLTQDAVIAWQKKHGLTPPIGYFGNGSRETYIALTTKLTSSSTTSSTDGAAAKLAEQVVALQKQLQLAKDIFFLIGE